ncbi:RhuM family protein [Herbaspirillum sp. NPDC087042]|uniref:RhuM family protein n=1 Tax=Herbaspirillum sp. NPDC087042 TaxID=3364004 RepID=UPI0038266592
MSAKKVIEKFGGQSALARLLGIQQSAISYWVKKGLIPAKWHGQLLDVASNNGIILVPADFITTEDAPVPLTAGAGRAEVAPEADGAEPRGNSHFLFYTSGDGKVKVQVIVENETVWSSQKGLAEIFGVDVRTVSEHLRNIFHSAELEAASVIRKFRITALDGKNYETSFYNLDAIISVGYRINSHQATQFRKWATTVLRDYLIKGFALDDDRLRQANQLFGKDYFDELLERIREIRASERRFYQKITDIYSQCSIDYDKDAPITQRFYAHVQDKLHYAIHGHTSAELIERRADASKPNMGLFSYKNEKSGGKLTRLDVTVGKNYLDEEELDNLNRLVSMYLDFAENFARRHIPMKMQEWADKLDGFLRFNAYEVLEDHGHVRRETAEKKAFAEFEKFRVTQDARYQSDFDRMADQIQRNKRLPKE